MFMVCSVKPSIPDMFMLCNAKSSIQVCVHAMQCQVFYACVCSCYAMPSRLCMCVFMLCNAKSSMHVCVHAMQCQVFYSCMCSCFVLPRYVQCYTLWVTITGRSSIHIITRISHLLRTLYYYIQTCSCVISSIAAFYCAMLNLSKEYITVVVRDVEDNTMLTYKLLLNLDVASSHSKAYDLAMYSNNQYI